MEVFEELDFSCSLRDLLKRAPSPSKKVVRRFECGDEMGRECAVQQKVGHCGDIFSCWDVDSMMREFWRIISYLE